MRTFLAAIPFVVGLILAGFAYECYSGYADASIAAEFYRSHPDQAPLTRQSSEEYITQKQTEAGRNRNLAILCGSGSLLFCVSGATLFICARANKRSLAPPSRGLNEEPVQPLEVMTRWASVALAGSVRVHYRRIYAVLFVFFIVLLIGLSLPVMTARRFTSAHLLLLIFNGTVLLLFFYVQRRGQKQALQTFDLSGVTLGDNRRLSWSEFKDVVYIITLRRSLFGGPAEEYLWRIELTFSSGTAWIIPQRVRNLDQIMDLIASLPGAPQERRV